MKERPILFSGEMVKAILEGRKTQTRRALKVQPLDILPMKGNRRGKEWVTLKQRNPNRGQIITCRYGVAGDRLWVRETWGPCDGGFCYRASEGPNVKPDDGRWHPSIHMFRKASRIDLEITKVRVQRLQDISEKDALAEGIQFLHQNFKANPVGLFCVLWDSINGTWDKNPYVWAISFERV